MSDNLDMNDYTSWDAGFEHLCQVLAPHFRRPETRARLRRYLHALLGTPSRKNAWQMAEAVAEPGPQGMQRLLNAASWDAAAVRDELRTYVTTQLGAPESILVLDETGFLKKGTRSVGVARQYSGTAGRIENQQVAVFLAYASPSGYSFIDRELYLPQEWTQDAARCRQAGVPSTVTFATKPTLAVRMLERAVAAQVPARWVVADSVYHTDDLRLWLEAQGFWYVLGLACTAPIWTRGEQVAAQTLCAELPADAWVRLSAGEGAQGARHYDWAWLQLPYASAAGMRHWLLVRRSIKTPSELAYYHAYASAETSLAELVMAAGRRWVIETGFAQAKGEIGLDHYQVRQWGAWYRFITLGLLAYAYLALLGNTVATAAPVTVPERRRLLGLSAVSAEERAWRLHWSQWRRAHQARAKRSHTRRRAGEPGAAGTPPPPAKVLVGLRSLTEGTWAGIARLLPRRQIHRGQPAYSDRTLLEAMLWVMARGVAWRALPEALGPWHTVYTRYQQWVKDEVWSQVVAILLPGSSPAAQQEVSL